MNKQKVIDQLLTYPLHTTLWLISSLLLIFSGTVKPPVIVALGLLATAVYTAIVLAQGLCGSGGCGHKDENAPS